MANKIPLYTTTDFAAASTLQQAERGKKRHLYHSIVVSRLQHKDWTVYVEAHEHLFEECPLLSSCQISFQFSGDAGLYASETQLQR
jgi:hypothetical protein